MTIEELLDEAESLIEEATIIDKQTEFPNVASIMHTVLKNTRRLTGDELELLDEEG